MAANHLTFPNLIQVFYGSGQPLDQLRRPLQQFLRDGILNGREASAENIVQAVDTLVNDMQEELTETAVRYKLIILLLNVGMFYRKSLTGHGQVFGQKLFFRILMFTML